MAKKSKKTDRQYPLFAVRLKEDQKIKVNELIDKVRDRLNAGMSPTEERWHKNDLIYKGLLLGLPLVKGKPSDQG